MTLYITDLDGTLLRNDKSLSRYTINTINKLIKRGMSFTYATARSWHNAYPLMQRLNLTIPIITHDGALIARPDNGAIMSKHIYDANLRDLAIDTFLSHNQPPLVYAIIDGKEKVMWLKGAESPGILGYIESRAGDRRLLAVDTVEELKVGGVFNILAIGPRGSLADLAREFGDGYYAYLANESNEDWFALYPAGMSKGTGVKRLKNMLNADKAICFGDNVNDVPMFEAADECYSVENAVDELKRAATGIIGNNDGDGVAKWLANNFGKS